MYKQQLVVVSRLFLLMLYLQYYDDTYPSVKEQKAFEKNIFSKTHRTDSKKCIWIYTHTHAD